jgi:hypothetical protein
VAQVGVSQVAFVTTFIYPRGKEVFELYEFENKQHYLIWVDIMPDGQQCIIHWDINIFKSRYTISRHSFTIRNNI